jgi:hypothetical protein
MTDSLFRLYAPDELATDGYPPEWHATIKHAVRAAAGNRCVRCGHPYGGGEGRWSLCDEHCTHDGIQCRLEMVELLPATTASAGPNSAPSLVATGRIEAEWRILTVDHLDGDKANCRWWNLAALCQRCHLTIQGRVVMARVWPWEHSEWFRPYVAGYYAHAYLGEDLTREETVSRLSELLALERVA